MLDMEVREVKKNEYQIWDELVENSPQGSIFHHSNWLAIHDGLFGGMLKIYGCFKNNNLIGGCSFYIYQTKFYKRACSIVEMTPYGGVIIAPSFSSKIREQEETDKNIIRALCSAFDNEHFGYIQLVNSPNLIDIRSFIWNGWKSKIHYTYYFNLEKDIEKSISKKVRNTARRAINNKITVKKLNDPSIFYDLLLMTFMRQNMKLSFTKGFFENVIELLEAKNLGEMWVAETPNGEIASSEIIIWDNKRVYRWSAASHTDFQDTGATSLLLYEIFQDLKKRGFKEINLMAANTPQLTKFISSFNPKLIPYYSVERKNLLVEIIGDITKLYKKIKGCEKPLYV
jgi:hypothetical protein